MVKCYKCGAVQEGERVYRNTLCLHCSAELKVCLMCLHYDHSSSNQCRESAADRVVEKDKANFCDWFSLNPYSGNIKADNRGALKQDNAKKAFNNLFGDS